MPLFNEDDRQAIVAGSNGQAETPVLEDDDSDSGSNASDDEFGGYTDSEASSCSSPVPGYRAAKYLALLCSRSLALGLSGASAILPESVLTAADRVSDFVSHAERDEVLGVAGLSALTAAVGYERLMTGYFPPSVLASSAALTLLGGTTVLARAWGNLGKLRAEESEERKAAERQTRRQGERDDRDDASVASAEPRG